MVGVLERGSWMRMLDLNRGVVHWFARHLGLVPDVALLAVVVMTRMRVLCMKDDVLRRWVLRRLSVVSWAHSA